MLHNIPSPSRVGLTALAVGLLPVFALAQVKGPSSSQTPYVLPVAAGVQTVSILTTGDAPTGYTFVGIPDGLGAYATPGGTFELLVNHEFVNNVGAVHDHGSQGAFISRWTINRSDLSVVQGHDQIQTANIVNGTSAFSRFCSGDLPLRRAFFVTTLNAPQIYLNGEETGAEGRTFAHVASGPLDGESYELPALGKMSFENSVARPFASTKTVVMEMDDTSPAGEVYCYIGVKKNAGTLLKRAGLTNGILYGIRVPGVPLEDRDNALFGQTRFELASLGNVSEKTGAQIQTDSTNLAVTQFLRPEDGTWSRTDDRSFYFVTTDRFDSPGTPGRSRLWQLTFDSASNPEQGGTIAMLLDGTEGQQMMDNITIDRNGNILIEEDVGNNAHLGRILQYTPSTDQLKVLAQHDPARFLSGGASFLTQDEEASGIIDAREILGPGWFLLDAQAHYAIPGDLVEGGQLLALYNPDSL